MTLNYKQMPRKMNRSKFRGGKVIGSGGQGCIFSPDWTSVSPQDNVLKFAPQESALQEYKIAMRIAATDPREQYGIYVKGGLNCDIPTSKLVEEGLTEDSGDTCVKIGQLNQNPRSVCAMSITKYISDMKHVPVLHTIQLMYGMRNLWKGLLHYQQYNYVHGDIKAENIAYTQGGSMVFADWGWAIDLSDCGDVDMQIDRIAMFSFYASEPIGTGPWCPLLFGSLPYDCEGRRQLLKFNDVFGLAKFQLEFINDLLLKDLVGQAQIKTITDMLSNIMTTEDFAQYNEYTLQLIEAFTDILPQRPPLAPKMQKTPAWFNKYR